MSEQQVREFFLDLARSGHATPIGTDLLLHEKPNPEQVALDGERLGTVIVEAAGRYGTPLGMPLMDLMVEKTEMLSLLGIPAEEIPTWHFGGMPSHEQRDRVVNAPDEPLSGKLQAHVGAVNYVAANSDLLPCGMAIGPFSLMTKLLGDPISPVYLAGMGMSGKDEPEVAAMERVLEMSLAVVLKSLRLQVQAGARAVTVCEPAANKVYLSPNQLQKGSDIFERYVVEPNRKIREALADGGAGLILHDCGELMDVMVERFGTLRPVMLSLGSSRLLWEDAARVPEDVVLYGNLPTKRFFDDQVLPLDQVGEIAQDLTDRMKETGHPFILGSECDVLSVAGSEDTIKAKVEAFLRQTKGTGGGCCCGD